MDLKKIRKEIDSVDDEILKLFLRRMELSEMAIKEKIESGKFIRDEKREKKIINSISKKSGDYQEYSKILFKTLISLSKKRQVEILSKILDDSPYYQLLYKNILIDEEINSLIDILKYLGG